MDSTCKKEACFFWQLGDGKCPNYIELWWTPAGVKGGPPKKTDDCAPQRLVLMVQELYNRLIGVQKAQEEMRNEAIWVQVVAEVLGRNSGIDLGAFVEERRRLQEINRLKELAGKDDA